MEPFARPVGFSILRVGFGLVAASLLFLEGMLAAEKYHAIGYALMWQALIAVAFGVACMFARAVPTIVSALLTLLDALIWFGGCAASSVDEMSSLKTWVDLDFRGFIIINTNILSLMILVGVCLFIKPLKRRTILIVASVVSGTFLISLLALGERMKALVEVTMNLRDGILGS